MTSKLSLHHKKFVPYFQQGFSLIEMAMVLVILGFLLAGLMMPLSSQHAAQKREEAKQQLEDIRNAIIGFAQVNNRLPCPASPLSNGVSVPNMSAVCTAGNNLVPYVTLGLSGTIVAGRLLDPWQQPILYYITSAYSSTPISISGAAAGAFTICAVSTPLVCPVANTASGNVVVVLLSTGDTTSSSPNPISASNVYASSPTETFDDIIVWISQPELIYALSKVR
jgi:prepilin-type N-terminal cleavage/methylation domain-containing protein